MPKIAETANAAYPSSAAPMCTPKSGLRSTGLISTCGLAKADASTWQPKINGMNTNPVYGVPERRSCTRYAMPSANAIADNDSKLVAIGKRP